MPTINVHQKQQLNRDQKEPREDLSEKLNLAKDLVKDNSNQSLKQNQLIPKQQDEEEKKINKFESQQKQEQYSYKNLQSQISTDSNSRTSIYSKDLQSSDKLDSSEIDLSNKDKKSYQQKQEDIVKKIDIQNDMVTQTLKSKRYLILGLTGVGKSSFIKFQTKNKNVIVGHGKASETKHCSEFKNSDDLSFIDSPGIDDTKEERSAILYRIAKYLHEKEYRPQDLFIMLVQNSNLQIGAKIVQEFAYAYFLCEIFQEEINAVEIDLLTKEYFQSNGLLNWTECSFNQLQDALQSKRKRIFQKKDVALNYQQMFNSYHIVIRTHFDQSPPVELQNFNMYSVQYLQEQIWSNNQENLRIFGQYKDYIQNQEHYLFQKVSKIIEIQNTNFETIGKLDYQNILLIGNSQVGKSSLIEQLTMISELRRDGKQSTTQLCKTYIVERNQTKYRFIDTPGFEGTEAHQTSTHSLKIIADYLRRNTIMDFKILFMVNSTEVRDKMDIILQKLFIFLEKMFDQDVGFQDSDYLNSLFLIEGDNTQNWKYEIDVIRDKILRVERKYAQAQDYDPNEIVENNIKTIRFQSDYFYNSQKISVDQDTNNKQINTLLLAIRQINSIKIEDKIMAKTKKLNEMKIVRDLADFQEKYNSIKKLYEELAQIQQKIRNSQNNQDLLKAKIDKLTQINKDFFAVSLVNYNSGGIKKYLKEQQNKLSNVNQNEILKHFVILQFDKYLFEQQTSGHEMFISRKQHYYTQFSHQLRCFFNQNNNHHLKKLEELSEIKTISDLAILAHLQQQQREKYFDEYPEKINDWIEGSIAGLNLLIGSGVQIYRYATYFRLAQDSLTSATKALNAAKANVFAVWANCVLAAISIGVDIFSYTKKQIGGNQLALNTTFNILSGVLSLSAFLIPGVGWIVGVGAGLVALAGYGISAGIYTCSATFDETIGLFVKNFIDDTLPNQNLLYFQKANFFQNKFKVKTYSELKGKGYDQYRELEKQNYENSRQKTILNDLFKEKLNSFPNRNYDTKDIISVHISQNHIYNKFKLEFKKLEKEDWDSYLNRIFKECQDNKGLINTFYQSYSNQSLKIVLNTQNTLIDQIKNKQKTLKKLLNPEIVQWDNSEEKLLENYEYSLNNFVSEIQQTNYTYCQQREFANGPWRKCDRFPILFKSFCNLIQQKVEFKYDGKVISDFLKEDYSFRLVYKKGKQNQEQLLKPIDKDQKIQQLDMLCATEKFVANRYLLKTEGQAYNLTSIADGEILDTKAEYCLDLYNFIKKNNIKEPLQFIALVKEEAKTTFDQEQEQRLQYFFESIPQLEEMFNPNKQV